MYGALAMSLSSFCVVTNALRLNLVNIDKDCSKDKNCDNKENLTMTKNVKVEGMMCHHCEMTVENALKAISGVDKAKADHTTGNVEVTLSKPVSDEIIKKAIEDKDYKVLKIK